MVRLTYITKEIKHKIMLRNHMVYNKYCILQKRQDRKLL